MKTFFIIFHLIYLKFVLASSYKQGNDLLDESSKSDKSICFYSKIDSTFLSLIENLNSKELYPHRFRTFHILVNSLHRKYYQNDRQKLINWLSKQNITFTIFFIYFLADPWNDEFITNFKLNNSLDHLFHVVKKKIHFHRSDSYPYLTSFIDRLLSLEKKLCDRLKHIVDSKFPQLSVQAILDSVQSEMSAFETSIKSVISAYSRIKTNEADENKIVELFFFDQEYSDSLNSITSKDPILMLKLLSQNSHYQIEEFQLLLWSSFHNSRTIVFLPRNTTHLSNFKKSTFYYHEIMRNFRLFIQISISRHNDYEYRKVFLEAAQEFWDNGLNKVGSYLPDSEFSEGLLRMKQAFRFYNLFIGQDPLVLISREFKYLPLKSPSFNTALIPFENFKFLVDYIHSNYFKNNLLGLFTWFVGKTPRFGYCYAFFLDQFYYVTKENIKEFYLKPIFWPYHSCTVDEKGLHLSESWPLSGIIF